MTREGGLAARRRLPRLLNTGGVRRLGGQGGHGATGKKGEIGEGQYLAYMPYDQQDYGQYNIGVYC